MIVYVWEKKISSVVRELKMRLVMSQGKKKNIKDKLGLSCAKLSSSWAS